MSPYDLCAREGCGHQRNHHENVDLKLPPDQRVILDDTRCSVMPQHDVPCAVACPAFVEPIATETTT